MRPVPSLRISRNRVDCQPSGQLLDSNLTLLLAGRRLMLSITGSVTGCPMATRAHRTTSSKRASTLKLLPYTATSNGNDR
ncbi:hypothetical protein VTN00DRAFT_7204 [Thermoascus crustaceus]|uniref:uncharacterized protein n=1 Tax=Thermoascus crustaceus TaxID=5088 RepID=UPI003743F1E7